MQEESLNIHRDDSSLSSKSLPEAVSIPDYTTNVSGDDSLLHPNSIKNYVPMINPLGAGDTCSGVFFLEYLDTHDSITSFRYGLAAASASCILLDCTSHFSKSTMKLIFDQIRVKTFVNV